MLHICFRFREPPEELFPFKEARRFQNAGLSLFMPNMFDVLTFESCRVGLAVALNPEAGVMRLEVQRLWKRSTRCTQIVGDRFNRSRIGGAFFGIAPRLPGLNCSRFSRATAVTPATP